MKKFITSQEMIEQAAQGQIGMKTILAMSGKWLKYKLNRKRAEKTSLIEEDQLTISGISLHGRELRIRFSSNLSDCENMTFQVMRNDVCILQSRQVVRDMEDLSSCYFICDWEPEKFSEYTDGVIIIASGLKDTVNISVPYHMSCGDESSKGCAGIYITRQKYFRVRKSEKEFIRFPYMISVIMAVYNTEPFLAEAIESILDQDISELQACLDGGHPNNKDLYSYDHVYELILVDDGSQDGSAAICDYYAGQYDHIKVIHKENGGVSSARNAGIAVASGKYLNFFDSDDKLTNNVFRECFRFYELHENEVSMVTFPLVFFDGMTSEHWTNYKFEKGSRVLALLDEWDKPLYMTASTFFKREQIQNKVFFDSNLKNGEDIKVVYTEIFREKPYIGLVSSCKYYYRRRQTGELSAIANSANMPEYYLPYMKDLVFWMIRESKQKYGFVPKYVQYAIMGQLQWRYIKDTKGEAAISAIGEDGYKEYRKLLLDILQEIEPEIIMAQKKMYIEQKFYLLCQKFRQSPYRLYDGENIRYYFSGVPCRDVASMYYSLEFLSLRDGVLHIEGINTSLEDGFETWFLLDGKKYPVKTIMGRDINTYCLNEPCFFRQSFSCDIPLEKIETDTFTLQLYTSFEEMHVHKCHLRLGKFMPITMAWKNAYYHVGGWVITVDDRCNLKFSRANKDFDIEEYETNFIEEIEKAIAGRTDPAAEQLRDAVVLRKKIRNKDGKLNNRILSRKIWIISDRVNMAGDNGEALFLYLQDRMPPDTEVYFAINADSEDYGRLQQYGNVIDRSSEEYQALHLQASFIISSHADEFVLNPFYPDEMVKTDVFRDYLHDQHFVFLQHGITKNDISGWINRYQKNIKGMTVAAVPEYQSVLDYPYFYTGKEVWLTGFARYDRLYHDEKNYITLMPTWREYLSVHSADTPGKRVLREDFKNSDYYIFYNTLLNDERLLTAADQYGYQICFMPHPTLWEHLDLFEQDCRVCFFSNTKTYREVYAESVLVMTDYSSAVMDFAYLRKPIVYCEFDKETFFAGGHVCEEGYFDDERDGFGEVTYDKDTLVEVMIAYMKLGCTLKDCYRKRIDQFFAFDDKDNCKRIYEKLVELSGREYQ